MESFGHKSASGLAAGAFADEILAAFLLFDAGLILVQFQQLMLLPLGIGVDFKEDFFKRGHRDSIA